MVTKRKLIVFFIILAFSSIILYPFFRNTKSRYIVHTYFNQPHWTKMQDYFKNYYPHPDSAIAFVGNSITEGFDISVFKNDRVLNFGIAGDFTSGVLKRMAQIIAYKPTKIFLLIGINDLIEKVDMKQIQQNHAEIVSRFQKALPNTIIYVHTVLPIRKVSSMITSNQSNTSKIMEYNQFIRTNYNNQKNITVVDLFPLYKDNNNEMKNEYTTDGIHLNKAGYKIWEDKIKKFIPEHSSQRSR